MKKFFCVFLAALMLAAAAYAENTAGFTFEELKDVYFEYSSGAGGWSTELQINPDGTFTGNYHDSEMGECADEYPDGTVYGCTFHGKFELGENTGSHMWNVTVSELELDEGQVPEAIEDGIRFVTSEEPYGLTKGHVMTLYTPGADTGALCEDCQYWFHLNDMDETVPETLPCYGIYDADAQCGFVGML